MQVIKKGRGQKGWAKEFNCTGSGNGGGGCGAVLLVDASDIYDTSSTDYCGGKERYKTFKCSECGVETDIDVPSNVKTYGTNPKNRSTSYGFRD